MTISALLTIRRHGRVQRWHTEDLTQQQQVGQHSWGMTMILLQTLGSDCSKELLVAALNHDLGEGGTGDVPAPAKWAFGSERLELLEEAVRNYLGVAVPALSDWEKWALKAADGIEGLLTTLEERMKGNLYADVIFARWVKALDSFFFETTVGNSQQIALRELYLDVRNAYNSLCKNKEHFLRTLVATDIWQPASAMVLRGIFESYVAQSAAADQRKEPESSGKPADPEVSACPGEGPDSLSEVIDDRFIS